MIKLIKQIIRFGFVGFLCFFIEYGIMVLLTEVFDVYYMVSTTAAYCISTVVNYILSVTIVFETDKNKNRFKEFLLFVLLSVIGLGVNELCMLTGVELLHIHYMIVKIGATAVVMVFNFVTRKIFIEKKSA